MTQAKNIDDVTILRIIERLRVTPWPSGDPPPDARFVFRWELEEALPDVPPKVVLAKARALLKRKLIDGCGCGCRGDFSLLPDGEARLR